MNCRMQVTERRPIGAKRLLVAKVISCGSCADYRIDVTNPKSSN